MLQRTRLKSFFKLRSIGRGKVWLRKGEKTSKSETSFFDQLESIYNVKIERQFCIRGRYFDGRFDQYLIEVDGERWHSSPKQKSLDEYKNELAKRMGFKIIRFSLNSTREIPVVISENSEILKEIFNGGQKLQISSSS